MAATIPSDSIISISVASNATIYRGSGVLLDTGLYVLTVAHLFDHYSDGQDIVIKSADGLVFEADEVFVHHGWDKTSTDFNHDIAIIKLSSSLSQTGLSLWDAADYEGILFTLTGFGNEGELHTGTNVFDGDGSLFNALNNKNIVEGTQVIYDYDNGLEAQNTSLGYFDVASSAEPTSDETIALFGDSGGALLVDDQVAAISSYIFSNSAFDINNVTDSSVGEVGVATKVSAYLPWIESITEGNPVYTVPTTASEVLTEFAEPFSGEVTNYFLLEMSAAQSTTVTLRYQTRDGTAIAGEDYQYTTGWVELQPMVLQVAIGVLIYGDVALEDNESFSMVVTDPSAVWMEAGVELIASHTIINNDLL